MYLVNNNVEINSVNADVPVKKIKGNVFRKNNKIN
jgi:hypothetical protein